MNAGQVQLRSYRREARSEDLRQFGLRISQTQANLTAATTATTYSAAYFQDVGSSLFRTLALPSMPGGVTTKHGGDRSLHFWEVAST
jgi:hypothetical protein